MPKTSIRDTSLKAYKKNKEERQTLKEKVKHALQQFYVEHKFWPTSNELHKYMMRNYQSIDFKTQIQPRLTYDLPEENKVTEHKKRECHVSGEKVWTWRKVK